MKLLTAKSATFDTEQPAKSNVCMVLTDKGKQVMDTLKITGNQTTVEMFGEKVSMVEVEHSFGKDEICEEYIENGNNLIEIDKFYQKKDIEHSYLFDRNPNHLFLSAYKNRNTQLDYMVGKLIYHSSFESLMPVLDKIEHLDIVANVNIEWDSFSATHRTEILPKYNGQNGSITFSNLSCGGCKDKLESIYNAIVLFIKLTK